MWIIWTVAACSSPRLYGSLRHHVILTSRQHAYLILVTQCMFVCTVVFLFPQQTILMLSQVYRTGCVSEKSNFAKMGKKLIGLL